MFKKEPVRASVNLNPKRGRFVFFDNTLYPIQNGQVIINGVAYPVMVKKMTDLPEWVWSWVVPNFGMKMKTFNYADTWSVYFLGDKYMIFQNDGEIDWNLSQFGEKTPEILAESGHMHYQFEGFDKRLMQRKNPLDPFYRDKYWDTPYYKDDEKCIKENKKRLEKAKREKRSFTDKVTSKYDGFVKNHKNITLGAEVFGRQRLYATDGPDSTAVRFSKEEWIKFRQKIYAASASRVEPSAVIKYFAVGVQKGDGIKNYSSQPIPMCADMLDMRLVASVSGIMSRKVDMAGNTTATYQQEDVEFFKKNAPEDADKIREMKKEYLREKMVGGPLMDKMWDVVCGENHINTYSRDDKVIYYCETSAPLEPVVPRYIKDYLQKIEAHAKEIVPVRPIMLHTGTQDADGKKMTDLDEKLSLAAEHWGGCDDNWNPKVKVKACENKKVALGSCGMPLRDMDKIMDIFENTLRMQHEIGDIRVNLLSFETLAALYDIIRPATDEMCLLEYTIEDVDSEFYAQISSCSNYLKLLNRDIERELDTRIKAKQFSLTVEEAKQLCSGGGKFSARKILRVPVPDIDEHSGHDFAPGYEREYHWPLWIFEDWNPDVQWTEELRNGTVEVHTGRFEKVWEDENGNYIRATLRAVPEHMGGAPKERSDFDYGAYEKAYYWAGDTGSISVSPPGIIFDVPADCAAIMSAETYEKVKAYIRGDEELIKTIKRREAVRVNTIYGIPPIPVVKTSGDSDSVQEYEDDYEG